MKQKPSFKVMTRPMVLHTRVVTGVGGGPEKTILNSPRYLQRYGFDCSCLFMHPPEDPGFPLLQKKAAAADADIIGIDDSGPLDTNVVRESVRICRERNVTIWHAHDYKSNVLGLLVRQFHPMYLVTTAHGWVRVTARTPLYYHIDRFCMKRYDQVICVSADLYQRCRQLGMPPERLSLVDNAIVLEDYCNAAGTERERAAMGVDPDTLLVGAAGRLSEEKGFHHLIDAVGRMVRSGRRVNLVIAGEGHLRDTLQQQIDDQKMQPHIHLCGFLPDPRAFYRTIDLFVLSSLREGLPNVVLEAMATARPVVATRCNGLPRLIQHEQNGLLVPTDNGDALFEAIRRCCDSESLRLRLAAAGLQTVREQFCFEQRMKKVVDVYRRLSPELADVRPRGPVALPPAADSAILNSELVVAQHA